VSATGVGIGAAPVAGTRLTVSGILNATELRQNGAAVVSSQWAPATGGISYDGGRVGIGVAKPGYLLDVADRIRVRQADTSPGVWMFNTAYGADRALFGMNGDDVMGLYGPYGPQASGGNPDRMGLSMHVGNSNVGIRAAPAPTGGAALTVGGALSVGGNVTVTGRVSDAKVRTQAPIAWNQISITNNVNDYRYHNVPGMSLSLSGGTFLILFDMGGVEPHGVTRAIADFRILIDGNVQPAYIAEAFNAAEWVSRAVSLECLVTLAAGSHTVVAQWGVRSPSSPTTNPTLWGCWNGDHRSLIAIEL
jgi:hypothetical protein